MKRGVMDQTLADNIPRGRKAIALARQRGMDTAEWEHRLREPFDEAGNEPLPEARLEPWMLLEWRRVSIPDWRNILEEGIVGGDARREEYARWMLREVLLDPDYEDPDS